MGAGQPERGVSKRVVVDGASLRWGRSMEEEQP